MAVTRSRVGSLVEWLVAAGVAFAIVAGGTLAVREVRDGRALPPVIAEEAAPVEVPAGIPPQTVSVPVLLLPDGHEIRVGDRFSEVALHMRDAAQLGPDLEERTGVRRRITRFYNHVGSRFALVLERAQPEADPRVTAILLQ